MTIATFNWALHMIERAFPRRAARMQRLWAGALADAIDAGQDPDRWIDDFRSTLRRRADEERRVRAALRARFGDRHYQITGRYVHAYGPMPNATHIDGWYLLGGFDDVLADIDDGTL